MSAMLELARRAVADEEARFVLEDMIRETGWWDDRIRFALSNGDDREDFLALLTWPGEFGAQHVRAVVQALENPDGEYLSIKGRGTGRTTRLLQDALKVAADGRRVLVLAVDPRHRDLLREMLAGLTVDADAIGRVTVATPGEESRHVQGRAPFDHVVEDHYTREVRAARRRMSPSIGMTRGSK